MLFLNVYSYRDSLTTSSRTCLVVLLPVFGVNFGTLADMGDVSYVEAFKAYSW